MAALVLTGDRVVLEPGFGAATVTGVLQLVAEGSAHPTAKGHPLVLAADLEQLVWTVAYTTASHTIPGTGTVRLVADDIPKTSTTTAAGKALATFERDVIDAELTVMMTASIPGSPPSPDTSLSYSGKARLVALGAAPDAA